MSMPLRLNRVATTNICRHKAKINHFLGPKIGHAVVAVVACRVSPTLLTLKEHLIFQKNIFKDM